ncbi:MAG TPA: alpha/beta fold hydrolase [Deltaproteobacteria bacterium]|nr:alpha/beta fold hydrolase [Deltaproteobacteria bacterium]
MKRIDADFTSMGLRCAAWLYLPEGTGKPPVVVMAHGFAGQRDFGLEPYAERFAEQGMAVLLFDYRNFGGSEGEPRNLVHPWRHLEDWRAAVSHARYLDAVDGTRLALWGTSFSGGHVMVTAAQQGGIRAVVAQVPFVDGIATTLQFPIAYQVEGVFHGLKDLLCMATGTTPHMVPAVAEPGTFACMNTPDAMEGYNSLVPPGSDVKNEVPARILLMVPFYRPVMYARRIKPPVLLMYAEHDSLIPARAVERMGARIQNAEVVGLPAGHFDVYTGELFRQVVDRQARFLAGHLFR